MKLLILLVLFFGCFLNLQAETRTLVKAQKVIDSRESASHKLNVIFELVPLRVKDYSFIFQYKLSDKFSIGPMLSYMPKTKGIIIAGDWSTEDRNSVTSNRLRYGLRSSLYFFGMNSHSPYLSLAISESKLKISDSSVNLSGTDGVAKLDELALQFTGGFQWQWTHVKILVGGGLKYFVDSPNEISFKSSDGSTTNYYLYESDITLHLDLGIGLSF